MRGHGVAGKHRYVRRQNEAWAGERVTRRVDADRIRPLSGVVVKVELERHTVRDEVVTQLATGCAKGCCLGILNREGKSVRLRIRDNKAEVRCEAANVDWIGAPGRTGLIPRSTSKLQRRAHELRRSIQVELIGRTKSIPGIHTSGRN